MNHLERMDIKREMAYIKQFEVGTDCKQHTKAS